MDLYSYVLLLVRWGPSQGWMGMELIVCCVWKLNVTAFSFDAGANVG